MTSRVCDLVAGVDEAGRGPLAGPVVAAAVILNDGDEITGLTDSKRLTDRRRRELVPIIEARALAFAVAEASVSEIDEINILHATLLAMRRAVGRLVPRPTRVLVDGNQDPRFGLPTRTVVKGDLKHAQISAASILAKVARDDAMLALDGRYPQYGFAQHKGYPTRTHLAALEFEGPCPDHRMSFRPVREARGAPGRGDAGRR